LLSGECQSFYKLPPLYPNTTVPSGDALPTHVHHQGSSYVLGTWVDGTPGVCTGSTPCEHSGTWAATPNGPPFTQFRLDGEAYYAAKGFWDNQSRGVGGGLRRIIFGWNKTPPNSQSLPRVITYASPAVPACAVCMNICQRDNEVHLLRRYLRLGVHILVYALVFAQIYTLAQQK
jgi:hypothetical protein